MFNQRLLILALAALLGACANSGGGGGGSTSSATDKELYSEWTLVGTSAANISGIDLTQNIDGSPGQAYLNFSYPSQCVFVVNWTGTHASGTAVLSAGTLIYGLTDPNCSSYNGTYTFTKTTTQLTICNSVPACNTYQ